jgi:ribonuclease HI
MCLDHHLYCDGGVVQVNPSPIGGTWAARLVEDGQVKRMQGGIITPAQAQMPTISNNLTEMLALVRGLALLPEDWRGTVFSDSQITLGRAFLGWKWTNTPAWLYEEFGKQTTRLVHWDQIHYVLLAGHPTRAQLAAGIGRHGYPVSEHNVWCDKMCQSLADQLPEKQL